MQLLRTCWNDHSLSIVLGILGLTTYAIGITLAVTTDWVRISDFILNLGHGFFPIAVFYFFSGPLRERNRPED